MPQLLEQNTSSIRCAAKVARQTELMTAAAESNQTLDAAQAEEHDTLASEIKAVDAHLVRLQGQEAANLARAQEITRTTDPTQASAERGGRAVVLSIKPTVQKGTAFVRYCKALVLSRGSRLEAVEIAKQWRDSTPEVELALKAAALS